MQWRICFIGLLAALPWTSTAQDDGRHRDRPRIVGQDDIATEEDQRVTIRLSDLHVETDSWLYPLGFSLELFKGDNYALDGNTVIPAKDFYGTLTVPAVVREGNRKSEKYPLKIDVTPVNDAPAIHSQQKIHTPEEQTVTISINQLHIVDPDDNDFTLQLDRGEHYVSSGNSVTPEKDFNGTLRVSARVSDGESWSDWSNILVDVTPVNDAPQITGQEQMKTDQHKPFAIPKQRVHVVDPDNDYPKDFTLHVLPSGDNTYSVSGNTVVPAPSFTGELTVRIKVNDGQADSPPFNFVVTVIRVNDAPFVSAQRHVVINEDEQYTIEFSDLTVSDSDNDYPGDFTLAIHKGKDYTADERVIVPRADFCGTLKVNVTVHDGYAYSNIFPFEIEVTPVNDAPKITRFENESLEFDPEVALAITDVIQIEDVDNDSLSHAEVAFHAPRYRPGIDELITDRMSELLTTHFDVTTGVLTISGLAPIDEYVQQIRSVRYKRAAAYTGPTESKIIFITVSDGEAVSDGVERIIAGDDVIVDLDIPTAFTPNGDLTNDTWRIRPLKNSDKLGDAIIRIYSPNGYLLFESQGFEQEWDGKINGEVLPAGSYYYTIEFNPAVSRTRFRGTIAILR